MLEFEKSPISEISVLHLVQLYTFPISEISFLHLVQLYTFPISEISVLHLVQLYTFPISEISVLHLVQLCTFSSAKTFFICTYKTSLLFLRSSLLFAEYKPLSFYKFQSKHYNYEWKQLLQRLLVSCFRNEHSSQHNQKND